jgi:hypothetical protein
MANPKLATTRAVFEATVHRTKNRLVSIPAEVQRQLGLERRANNHILHFSIRADGAGRWNSHWAQLTADNEFAIPTDVKDIEPGSRVEVKIHGAVAAIDVLASPAEEGSSNPGSLLLDLAESDEEDPRTDGSVNIDEYLRHG